MLKKAPYLLAFCAICLFSYLIVSETKPKHQTEQITTHIINDTVLKAVRYKIEAYGIQANGLKKHEGIIQKNQFLADILLPAGLDYQMIHKISLDRSVFDVRKMKTGNKYSLFSQRLNGELKPKFFVYEQNKIDYVVFDFSDSVEISKHEKEVVTIEKTASGIVDGSLYMSLLRNEDDPQLATRLSEIYAWTIDFYRIQKGDKYKIFYTERFVEGESIGFEDVKACLFDHFGKELYAFSFQQDSSLPFADYYDETGNSHRRAFLQAPVKYSRISSKYTKKRYHPVQKRWKVHLGTDYVAPAGTPIYSTADGVITHAQYKKYNGNYVKVKHNGTYTTQYLHMSKIKSGIKPGVYVQQGDIIGYIGSTGLATGPHVCYRFWKNGKQVDPYQQDLPSAEPIKEEHWDKFTKEMQKQKAILDSVPYPSTLDEVPQVLAAHN